MKARLSIELLRMAWMQANQLKTDVWYNFDDFTNVMEYDDEGDVVQEHQTEEK